MGFIDLARGSSIDRYTPLVVPRITITDRLIFSDGSYQITAPGIGCAHMYVVTPVATPITLANTFYKLLGTTGVEICDYFTHSNNRLTYTFSTRKEFHVIGGFSISCDNKDIVVSFMIYQNGDGGGIESSIIKRTLRSVGDFYIMAMSAVVTLVQNDYVELWGASDTPGVQITLQTMGLVMMD